MAAQSQRVLQAAAAAAARQELHFFLALEMAGTAARLAVLAEAEVAALLPARLVPYLQRAAQDQEGERIIGPSWAALVVLLMVGTERLAFIPAAAAVVAALLLLALQLMVLEPLGAMAQNMLNTVPVAAAAAEVANRGQVLSEGAAVMEGCMAAAGLAAVVPLLGAQLGMAATGLPA